jgi:uncharacterized membrane protein YbhN (UPF0104 family)
MMTSGANRTMSSRTNFGIVSSIFVTLLVFCLGPTFLSWFAEKTHLSSRVLSGLYGALCGSAALFLIGFRAEGSRKLGVITMGWRTVLELSLRPHLTLRQSMIRGIAATVIAIFCAHGLLAFLAWHLSTRPTQPMVPIQLPYWLLGFSLPGVAFALYIARKIQAEVSQRPVWPGNT